MRFWAAPRSLVATYGISVDFFSSGYLDISVPRVRSVHLCIQCTVPPKRWVSPFGHCRIKACCQLPDTFRRLPRPSSPLTAKASTVYAWSLDHITPSRLRAYSDSSSGFGFRQTTLATIASTTHLGSVSNQNACHSFTFSKNTTPASAPVGFNQSLCARVLHIRSGRARYWWSQSGSNRRPPACKAGALPAELWPRKTVVVGLGGLEPPASPLSGVRSNHLSYRPISFPV